MKKTLFLTSFLLAFVLQACATTNAKTVNAEKKPKWINDPAAACASNEMCQTRWGTFPLRHFFSDSYVTENGEELSTRQIKAVLRDLIEAEDQHHPLSDDALREQLTEKGFPIARRTVAKYREALGIPIARLRKEK